MWILSSPSKNCRRWFDAKDIDISTLEGTMLDNASYFGRIFARVGGLSEAVAQALKEHNISPEEFTANPIICNGLAECDKALRAHQLGKLENNFIEGMCCPGGCIGGPACINHSPKDANEVTKYGKTPSSRRSNRRSPSSTALQNSEKRRTITEECGRNESTGLHRQLLPQTRQL